MNNNSLSHFEDIINKIKILGTYEITYIDRGISQYKNLISSEDYSNYVCPVLPARLKNDSPLTICGQND